MVVEGFAADGPVAIRDLQARRSGRPGLFEEEGIRAALLVPMRARGRVVGLLCLADPEPRDFSPEETESALMLAALTAGALETERQIAEIRDAIADREADQAGVRRAERTRVLAALGAGLTRELHPVFATLLGRAQLLLARAPSDPLRDGLVALEEAAWRGTDLLQRLLGLAEADQRGGVAELPAIAQEAVSFARARLRAEPESRGAIEMTADLGATPPVEAGAVALREAVVGLVLNAVEAMPAGGTLSVRTRGHDGGAELVLVDTGEGIPPEIYARIFDPFFTTRPGHLGLGLSVAEAVVLRAGGRLEVDRAGAGGGTRVTVWLPAAGRRPAAPPPEAAEPARPTAADVRPHASLTGSVLVVEEEEGIRTEVLDTLMAVGHRVEAVPDADAALARLGQGGIDVVLTDLGPAGSVGAPPRVRGQEAESRDGGGVAHRVGPPAARGAAPRIRRGRDAGEARAARSGPRSGRGRAHPPPPGVTRPRRLATVDLGTNTVRLLVVEVTDGEARDGAWHALDQTQRVTRLGEGQAAAGRLLPEPMRRTAAAVAEFAHAARRLGATRVRIVATSAVREAGNRGEFVARLEAESGESVEVISGEDEARLTLQGVTSGLPGLGDSFVLFDIGGGSTEFVLARAHDAAAAVSLRLGVVPLVEEWGEAGPVRWDRFARMREAIERRLAAEVPEAIVAAGADELVGTAGTVTTLAALDLDLPAYDAARVHGHRLGRAAVERELSRLGALSVADRGRLPCLEPGRADVIIPGIAICLATMARFRCEHLVVSDRGLREGILCELLGAAR